MAKDVDAVKKRERLKRITKRKGFSGLTELYIVQPLKATLVTVFIHLIPKVSHTFCVLIFKTNVEA